MNDIDTLTPRIYSDQELPSKEERKTLRKRSSKAEVSRKEDVESKDVRRSSSFSRSKKEKKDKKEKSEKNQQSSRDRGSIIVNDEAEEGSSVDTYNVVDVPIEERRISFIGAESKESSKSEKPSKKEKKEKAEKKEEVKKTRRSLNLATEEDEDHKRLRQLVKKLSQPVLERHSKQKDSPPAEQPTMEDPSEWNQPMKRINSLQNNSMDKPSKSISNLDPLLKGSKDSKIWVESLLLSSNSSPSQSVTSLKESSQTSGNSSNS